MACFKEMPREMLEGPSRTVEQFAAIFGEPDAAVGELTVPRGQVVACQMTEVIVIEIVQAHRLSAAAQQERVSNERVCDLSLIKLVRHVCRPEEPQRSG